jgi:hypothetical protein
MAQQENGPPTPESEALAGIERLMRALELLLESIPQFDPPYVDENGDIVIPRHRAPEDEAPAPMPDDEHGPEDDATSTAT